MKRLAALFVVFALLPGCFTTFGAVAGSKSRATDPYAANRAIVAGAVLDAVIIGVLLSKLDGGWVPSDD